MKLLALCALLCAMVALSSAEAAAEPEPENAKSEVDVDKRTCWWKRPCWTRTGRRWKRPCWTKIVHRWKRPCWTKIGHKCKRPSWTKIGCRYFFYVRQPLTWHQAERNCRRLGGHLASVHSRRQYLKIRALIKKSSRGSPATWIGGNDRCREGHWRWSDGSRLNYKNWCCGEPNNAGNQDCLQMNFSRRKCWDDAQCWLKRPSVCVRNRRR
ncbi:galactose-specific lectin nattectin-like isoform X2 [Labrus mixtus]|uniref:galactose-specific lectin nattectin-like isoform X2 n=1 Tax=Labrus mixtus TaxID=508554 RepID=UPI0029C03679|nr:galactose-specific lectin nattectin-like isoform X2 [Labrus mixtus]XP_060886662.1 galactose-specific lectin nattectin-like isoform X2 [Labrus mixtus]